MNPHTGEVADPDVLNPEVDTPAADAPPPKNPRDIALAEIARRANARREKEQQALKFDTIDDNGVITPAAPSVEPAEPAPEASPNVQPDASEAQGASPPPPSTPPVAVLEEERELIVDGKRIRVPVSKIVDAGIRTFQKETAADMRLAAATELLRSAQERQAQPPAPPPVVQPSDEDAVLARQIQFGTEEEAKAAIAKLRNAAPAISPQQIAAYVQQTLAQTLPDHTAFHEANRWLRQEFAPIAEDPDLKFLFDTKEDQARKAGDRRPYKELYADIAGQITTKFNLKKPEQAAPQPTTQASDRITRKAQSPRAVTGASGRMEQAQAPARAMTVAEYVQHQRQVRGLQPLDKQGI